MQERRSASHDATSHGAKHADHAGPGKSTLVGKLDGPVQARAAAAVKGGDDNVDIDHLNTEHAGQDTARLGQEAELKHLEHKLAKAHSAHDKKAIEKKIEQIKHDHKGFQITKGSPLYDQEGRVMGNLPAHTAVLINAGTLTKIKLNPGTDAQTQVAGPSSTATPGHKVVECAFVFETIDPQDPAGARKPTGAWIPTAVLPAAARKDERALASKISHARDDKHDQFDAQPIAILTAAAALANPPDLKDKFTYPKGKQFGRTGARENQAQDYLNNLSLNVPRSGGERFGVETTRLDRDLDNGATDEGTHPSHPLDAYHEFFPEEPRKEVAINLYDLGGTRPSGQMFFVYGYVKTSANAKIYGWINKKQLST